MTWTVHESDSRCFAYHRDDEHLDELVNVDGVNQLAASRLLWAPAGDPPPLDAPMVEHQAWARRRGRDIIRQGMADVLTWLAGGVADAAQ